MGRNSYKWFFIKKVLAVVGSWWVLVDISWLGVGGGGWWWIYFGWWWEVVDGGGWWLSSV